MYNVSIFKNARVVLTDNIYLIFSSYGMLILFLFSLIFPMCILEIMSLFLNTFINGKKSSIPLDAISICTIDLDINSASDSFTNPALPKLLFDSI